MPRLDLNHNNIALVADDKTLPDPSVGTANLRLGSNGAIYTRTRGRAESMVSTSTNIREFRVGPGSDYPTVKDGIDDNQDLITSGENAIKFIVDGVVVEPDLINIDYTGSSFNSTTTYIEVLPSSLWEISSGGGISFNQPTVIYSPASVIDPPTGGVENHGGRVNIHANLDWGTQSNVWMENLYFITRSKAVVNFTVDGVLHMTRCTSTDNNNTCLISWKGTGIYNLYITQSDLSQNLTFDLTGVAASSFFLRHNSKISVSDDTSKVLDVTKCVFNNFENMTNVTIAAGSSNALDGVLI